MVKVISLSEKAYKTLKWKKLGKESFSDVVLRLSEKKKPLLSDLAGKWHGSKEETDKIIKDIYKNRKKMKLREVRFD